MDKRRLSRREFIRAGAIAGAGLALPGVSAFAAEGDALKKNIQADSMSYIALGRTKMLVSRLSLGGVPWSSDVGRKAVERGCNLVHGSMGYEKGKNISDQGECLKGLWDKVFFLLKGDASEANVDAALKALRRDYVDMVLPVCSAPHQPANPKVREGFERLKKAGKVRFLGLTVHSKEALAPIVEAGVKAGFYDAVLTMYQPANRESLLPVLKQARAAGMGTISMKTVQGVQGGPNTQAKVIEAALSDGEIDTVLKGIRNLDEFDVFAKIAQKQKSASLNRPISDEEIRRLADRSVCGGCGSCARACHCGLDVPEMMRCVTYYAPHLEAHARQTYREIPFVLTAAACEDCGECERVCPRGLPIRSLIRQADRKWAV